MLRVYSAYGIEDHEDNVIELDKKNINKAAASAIAAIKEELPEETQTVEVLDYVLERMKDAIHSSRVSL